jgi:hypothetical protein
LIDHIDGLTADMASSTCWSLMKMGPRKTVAKTCWIGALVLDDIRMCQVTTYGPDHGHPTINFFGIATNVAKKVSSG